jgi:hypothetical protein
VNTPDRQIVGHLVALHSPVSTERAAALRWLGGWA